AALHAPAPIILLLRPPRALPTLPDRQHPNHALHPRLPPTSRIASALSSPAHLRASAPTGKPHIPVTQQRNYNMQTSRWQRIPKAPNVASKVYTPLWILMNDGVGSKRGGMEVELSSKQLYMEEGHCGATSSYKSAR
ncbi:hypothetical protein JB92DRAFT_2959986, partial [Gautieria morchelliformis]